MCISSTWAQDEFILYDLFICVNKYYIYIYINVSHLPLVCGEE